LHLVNKQRYFVIGAWHEVPDDQASEGPRFRLLNIADVVVKGPSSDGLWVASKT
jgi:hypothetical protein